MNRSHSAFARIARVARVGVLGVAFAGMLTASGCASTLSRAGIPGIQVAAAGRSPAGWAIGRQEQPSPIADEAAEEWRARPQTHLVRWPAR